VKTNATKRILLLTQWFDPEPTAKGLPFAKELVRRGYDVEVVTGFPNYPDGKLYPGYRMSWLKRETIDGVRITRLPLYPSHDASALRRLTTYATFSAAATWYCLLGAKRPDVVYVYQLPSTGVVAALIKAFRGSALVFDVQDVWPDALRATGMVNSERLLAAVGRVARWIYRRADAVVVLSPGFRRLLIDRGVPDAKIELIYNWCDEAALGASGASAPEPAAAKGEFRLVFAGNMGKAQSLGTVLDAADRLRTEGARVHFVFVGGGVEVENLKAIAKSRAMANVTFLPRMPMNRVGEVLQSADAVLVHLRDDPIFASTIPSKIQAYMALGKPILVAVHGDAAELVRQAQCGVEATPEDAASIAAAARQLASCSQDELASMGQRAKDFYRDHLSMAVGADRFGRLFETLTHAQHG
jgi:glycosyltransferase involved in cell wall biosynthesis